MRSRIEPMMKIAPSLRQHRELILNYFLAQKRISGGVVEGLNNKTKVTMRKSYGFAPTGYSNWPSITHLASCLNLNQRTISSEESNFGVSLP
jgi:transposase